MEHADGRLRPAILVRETPGAVNFKLTRKIFLDLERETPGAANFKLTRKIS